MLSAHLSMCRSVQPPTHPSRAFSLTHLMDLCLLKRETYPLSLAPWAKKIQHFVCGVPYRDLNKAALLLVYFINSKSQVFWLSSA